MTRRELLSTREKPALYIRRQALAARWRSLICLRAAPRRRFQIVSIDNISLARLLASRRDAPLYAFPGLDKFLITPCHDSIMSMRLRAPARGFHRILSYLTPHARGGRRLRPLHCPELAFFARQGLSLSRHRASEHAPRRITPLAFSQNYWPRSAYDGHGHYLS